MVIWYVTTLPSNKPKLSNCLCLHLLWCYQDNKWEIICVSAKRYALLFPSLWQTGTECHAYFIDPYQYKVHAIFSVIDRWPLLTDIKNIHKCHTYNAGTGRYRSYNFLTDWLIKKPRHFHWLRNYTFTLIQKLHLPHCLHSEATPPSVTDKYQKPSAVIWANININNLTFLLQAIINAATCGAFSISTGNKLECQFKDLRNSKSSLINICIALYL